MGLNDTGQDAIKERVGINTDAMSWIGGAEELFKNVGHYSDFAENLRKAEIEMEAQRKLLCRERSP
jgi:hypothetical protein